ncbi:hypothetical protein CEXT_128481 [Caerostris extrusa]|uniref:Uncharacterized protein n=1 Tax=Caerostris extrusa TaxID=172846 RepID=A0AAV4S8P9_CAEEX|nr:hypothetical protein CEXT_128481 [Caerostris extrusa]
MCHLINIPLLQNHSQLKEEASSLREIDDIPLYTTLSLFKILSQNSPFYCSPNNTRGPSPHYSLVTSLKTNAPKISLPGLCST